MAMNWWFVAGMLIGVVAVGLGLLLSMTIWPQGDAPPTAEIPAGQAPPAPATPATQASPTARSETLPTIPPRPPSPQPARRNTTGWQMIAAGRLREAQDQFLQTLLTSPDEQDAMRGLIVVRRRLAGQDPVNLRRQAAAYEQAMARRAETEEHYTVEAMAMLARANLLAAGEIEAERGSRGQPSAPSPPAFDPQPSPTRQVRQQPTVSPIARAVPTPARIPPQPVLRTPPPAPVPPQPALRTPPAATPAPQASIAEPSPDANEPFYLVQVGPISDAGRVSEIAGELTLSGYAAAVSRRGDSQSFQVVSETLPRSVARRRAQALTALGFRSRLVSVTRGVAQLEFGVFPSLEGAEALAGRIRTHGYRATVVRAAGSLYMITLGPYRQSVTDTIVRLIRSRFGAGLAVTVNAAP